MEYLLIAVLQILGIGFKAWLTILNLDKKFTDDTLEDVMGQFWKSDRITLFISFWIMVSNLVFHFILNEYSDFPETINYYLLFSFAIAFVLGFGGQAIVYKYLGKAENVLMRKADKLDNL